MNLVIDRADDITTWTALNNDCTNLTAGASHLLSASINFDKANGSANTVYAIVHKTIQPINLGRPEMHPHDKIYWAVNCPDLTNLANAVIRLGYDSSNYIEYRYPDSSLTAGKWCVCSAELGTGWTTAIGVDFSAVTYLAVGFMFDAETNALADNMVNYIYQMEVYP